MQNAECKKQNAECRMQTADQHGLRRCDGDYACLSGCTRVRGCPLTSVLCMGLGCSNTRTALTEHCDVCLSARGAPILLDSARFDSTRFESVRFNSTRLGSIRPDSIRSDPIRSHPFRFDSILLDSILLYPIIRYFILFFYSASRHAT
jgi:hypothetical protein